MSSPPPRSLPFFATAEQRLALARQRFFDEGVRPSGLVSEAVIQSWARCTQARRDPHERVAFEPVTPSRLHGTLARSRELLQAAAQELERLELTLAGTRCRALLTDRNGVVVHATRSAASTDRLLPVAARVGVNLGENVVGTTAPGVVVKTGGACTVTAGEHYFDAVQLMHCAAAPIRDVQGQLAGVLDLSIESRPFGFDAASVVGLSAMAIENRLLQAQSSDLLVLQFQAMPALLDGPLQALAGVDGDGRVVWLNTSGARLVGAAAGDCEALFGQSLPALLASVRQPAARATRLPNGLTVWLQARLQARDGTPASLVPGAAVASSVVAAAPGVADEAPPPTLGAHSRALIERTLDACGGNISAAARRLGVSRGLLYRRLGGAPQAGSPVGGSGAPQ